VSPVGIANVREPSCAEGWVVPEGGACTTRCKEGFLPTQPNLTCAGGRLAAFACEPAFLVSADTCADTISSNNPADTISTLATDVAVPACCDATSCTCTEDAGTFAEAVASCDFYLGQKLCSSDAIAGGACATCNAGACGGPVWTRSQLPCSPACVAAFVDDCVALRVEEGAEAIEAYKACRLELDMGSASAWDADGACEEACVPTEKMLSARYFVPGCVDLPFEVDWSIEGLGLISQIGAGYWPFGAPFYGEPPFSEAGITCSDYGLKCGGPSLPLWDHASWPHVRHTYHRDRRTGLTAFVACCSCGGGSPM
jgi:hypothetical protein